METHTVIRATQETAEIVTLRFTNDNRNTPRFEPGQYVTVYFSDLGVPEGKAYSLSSCPSDPYLSITVKAIGPYSNRLCSLRPGDKFAASKPYGFLFEDTGRPIVCIAAGVGISPLWSIQKHILSNDPSRNITLLYSNKSKANIAFRGEINILKQASQSYVPIHFITREEITVQDSYKQGRITLDVLDKLHFSTADFVLCGNEEFIINMYRLLKTRNVADDAISTEIFY